MTGALDVRVADLFLGGDDRREVEAVYRPLLEACRRHNLGKRDVDRLISVVRTMFAA